MLSTSELQARLQITSENKAEEEARLAVITQKINQVEEAKARIRDIKQRVNQHITNLQNLDCTNTSQWRGSTQQLVASHHSSSLFAAGSSNANSFDSASYLDTGIGGYWFDLDALADDLENSLYNLKCQRE